MKQKLTAEQVEREIAELSDSADVKLYKKYEYAVNCRRQRLYQLRFMAKKGRELRENGVTEQTVAQILASEG